LTRAPGVQAIKELLDKQPYSRAFLWALLVIVLIVFRACQLRGSEKYTRANWQSAIDERIERVTQSIHSLNMPDEQLLACIRTSALDRANIHPLNSGGIDDVRELQLLYCRNHRISNLDGIGLLSRLTFFDVSNNSVQSLSPLKDHPNLKILHAQENPLRDIRVAKTLPSLEQIYLPDLPDQPCADLERLLKGLRSNLSSIECAGKDRKQVAAQVQNSATTSKSRRARTDELTDAEHQKLLEYEQNRRYENR
jgi:Leucine-rich repeat (LRR) protein